MTKHPRDRVGYRAGAVLAAASAALTLASCSSDDAEPAATTEPTSVSSSTTASTTASAAGVNTADPQAAGAGETASFGISQSETRMSTEYVGVVEGTEVYGAFVLVRDNESGDIVNGMAYFCDSENVASWFHLEAAVDGTLTFGSKSGATFEATVDGDTVTADLALDGVSGTITATEVPSDGDAGLFLADTEIASTLDDTERAGWIVLTDGSQRGALKSGTTVVAGTTLTAGSTSVTAGGRDIKLLAIDSYEDPMPWF